MEPYAVIETGGKQYKIKAGDKFEVERLAAKIGDKLDLEPVLAFSDGSELALGTPRLDGVKVAAEVVDHIRGPKLVAFKKKRRKGFRRKKGHRQALTVLKVSAIGRA